MDEIVLRGMAKWPDVPDVYGWLSLDRRGNWLLRSTGASDRFERIGNLAVREFIGRNYAADARGCWYFQNGPQRVFVALAYAPWVVHWEADGLKDQSGALFSPEEVLQDEEGSVLVRGRGSVALLDDRDLERYAEQAGSLPRTPSAGVPARFGFIRNPAPGILAPR
jgi:hypothetical protein